MDRRIHISFNAGDRSYFSILKKEIHNIAAGAGFNEQRTGEVDIVIAEMVSNLAKYAIDGEILVNLGTDESGDYLEVLSIDNGPGMSEPLKMVEDGISTVNTLGHGLGSIKRLSDTFDIYSLKDWGTVVLARLYKQRLPELKRRARTEVRAIVVAKPGETDCGDACYFSRDEKVLTIFVADGLGHGTDAQTAAHKAIDAVVESRDQSPSVILRDMHVQVRKTRGLVGTIVKYTMLQKKWSICGIGNVAAKMYSGMEVKTFMSYNGIIGMNIPGTMKDQEFPGERGQLLILCSDGIRTRWDLQKYPGIQRNDLSVIAAAIYKDHARRTDDMSVIVARINTGS